MCAFIRFKISFRENCSWYFIHWTRMCSSLCVLISQQLTMVGHQRVYCWLRNYKFTCEVPAAVGDFETPLLTRWFVSYWLTQSRKISQHFEYLYEIHSCFDITVWGPLLLSHIFRWIIVENQVLSKVTHIVYLFSEQTFYNPFSHYTCVYSLYEWGMQSIPDSTHMLVRLQTYSLFSSLYNLLLRSYFIIFI